MESKHDLIGQIEARPALSAVTLNVCPPDEVEERLRLGQRIASGIRDLAILCQDEQDEKMRDTFENFHLTQLHIAAILAVDMKDLRELCQFAMTAHDPLRYLECLLAACKHHARPHGSIKHDQLTSNPIVLQRDFTPKESTDNESPSKGAYSRPSSNASKKRRRNIADSDGDDDHTDPSLQPGLQTSGRAERSKEQRQRVSILHPSLQCRSTY